MMLPKLTSLIILVLLSTAAQAKFYQCTKDGKVFFSDRQCEGERKELHIRSNKPATNVNGTTLERQKKYLDAVADEKAFNHKQAEAKAKIANKQAEECQRLRDNLKTYQGPGLVYEEKEDGERVYLTDKQRQSDMEKIKKEIAAKCK